MTVARREDPLRQKFWAGFCVFRNTMADDEVSNFISPLFLAGFGTLVLVGVLHIVAIEEFWYWKYLWLDTGIHLLAGVTIGLLLLWVFVERLNLLTFGPQALYLTLLLGFFIGILWEVFEFYYGIPKEINYYFDSSLDLLMDVVGIIIANVMVRLYARIV
jgi:hypothetical protein